MHTMYKKIITLLLVLVIIASPALAPFGVPKAQAINVLQGVGSGLVGCASSKLIGGLTSKLSGLFGSKAGGTNVPVADSKVGTEQASSTNKETCLNVIAKSVAQQLLKDLTLATVNWINSGFKGSPAYVQNTGQFFLNVAKEELGGYVAKIGFDSQRFPFGKDTARAIARSWLQGGQAYLDNNASYSLNTYLNNHPQEAFANDFSVGGWDAFVAQAFFPGNNPIGFQMAVAQQIHPIKDSISLTGTHAGELQQELGMNKGFLSLKKCVDPTYYVDPADETDTDWNMTTALQQAQNDPNDQDTQDALYYIEHHTCKRWEVQTPGGVIADKLTTAVNIPENNLLNAEDLDESLTAIFDALASQLFSMGVKALSDSSGDSSLGSSSSGDFGGYGQNTSDFGSSNGSGSSSWYNMGRDFELITAIAPNGPNRIDPDPACAIGGSHPSDFTYETDCIQGGFDEQGLLVVLKEYTALANEITGRMNEAVRWIHELDYCVPGPRPTWEDEAAGQIEVAFADYDDAYSKVKEDELATTLNGILDPGGFLAGFNEEEVKDDRRDAAAKIILLFSGFDADARDDGDDTDLQYPSNVKAAIAQVAENYINITKDYYTNINTVPIPLSGLNVLNRQEYTKESVYLDTIATYQEEVSAIRTTIPRLKQIYDQLIAAQLHYHINNNPTDSELAAYKRYYDTEVRIFAGMTANLKTGDDIDNLMADLDIAKSEISLISDPQAGLVKMCSDDLNNIPAATYTRRAYETSRPSDGEYTAQGWTSLPAFRSATPSGTFLPGYRISANTPDSTTVYIGTHTKNDGGDTYLGVGNNGGPFGNLLFLMGRALENSMHVY